MYLIYFYVLSMFHVFCSVHAAEKENENCSDYVSEKMCVKIGQMLMVGFGGAHIDDVGRVVYIDKNNVVFSEDSNIARAIKDYHVGNIIIFNNTDRDPKNEQFIRDRNVQGPKQLATLNHDLKMYSNKVRAEQGLTKLPLFIAIDEEGGMVDRLEYDFGFRLPRIVAQALGEKERLAGDDRLKKEKALQETLQYANKIGGLLQSLNIDINFAPVVDVNLNPTNPVIGALGRSYSNDPTIVLDQARQMINGFHQNNIIAGIKHFPGHGSSVGDSHHGFTDVTDYYQKEKELLPYRTLFQEGYQDIVMTTHVVNGKIDSTQCKKGEKSDRTTWCPGTMSSMTLTTLLRKDLGFKGVLVSDDMMMGAIAKEYSMDIALEKAINAGVDIFIVSNHKYDWTPQVVLTIAKLVHGGRVKEERINEAYARIIKMKKTFTSPKRE